MEGDYSVSDFLPNPLNVKIKKATMEKWFWKNDSDFLKNYSGSLNLWKLAVISSDFLKKYNLMTIFFFTIYPDKTHHITILTNKMVQRKSNNSYRFPLSLF